MKRLLICLCLLQVTASAHVLDEYLQAAQLTLTPDGVRVELRLTPGVDVADRVFALIDLDLNGEISSSEEQDYARRVLDNLTLELDQRRLPLALTATQFPARSEMKEGVGVIRFDLAAPAVLSAGDHQLAFRNNYLSELGVYQANALVPATESIKITAQERDAQQHELRLHVRVAASATSPVWPGVLLGGACLTLLAGAWYRYR